MDNEKLDAITEILRVDYPDVTRDEVESYLDTDWIDTDADGHSAWLESATPQAIADWAWTLCMDTRNERRAAQEERQNF